MSFTSNGLLGPRPFPPVSDVEPPRDHPESISTNIFTLNGLLNPTGLGATDESTESISDASYSVLPKDSARAYEGTSAPVNEDTYLEFDSAGAFTPTNLLGSGSQDVHPLSVSESFGFPTNLLSRGSRNFAESDVGVAGPSHFSIRATTFEGKTVYMKRKPKISHEARNKVASGSQRMSSLLDVPIHRMLDELSSSAAARLHKAELQELSATKSDFVEDTLWVDKYRPYRFTDLMGNERVARETMTWVKQWDWCVFGKRKGKKRARDDDEDPTGGDEYHRPKEKLLLLSGPPGLGKTTLAHVIATQAGYEVMEINASDARSGQVVDDRIQPALESGSAVGSSKPVLLIIDEIDGATGAGESSNNFIHKLVQLTYDKPRQKNRTGRGRDPKAKRPILRPIICICNDHNASSLAKLRPHALQIRFSRPADVHTVKRLREVCDVEGLKADTRALNTLVGVAKGDLRGCLNTLQFIKTRNEEVTESVIRGATTGMKQSDTSVVSVLNDLFSPINRKRVKELAMSEEEEARYVGRLGREIESSGRESGVAVGCFTHYITLRKHDATFSRYEKANEWLATFDLFSAAMYTDGDFALHQYLPYTLVPFYPLFQERGGERVERGQADWENIQLTRANEEIYKSLSRCLRTASTRNGGDYRHLLSTPILQLEFAPLINRIISPPIRPVNRQVIKPEEKTLLTRLVTIMASLELRFAQERAEDGQLSYRLDPPIDVFVTYDGKRASDIAVSRYAVRHLVAGEVDAYLISQQADVIEKGKRSKHEFFGSSKRREDAEEFDFPNKRAKIDIADKPPTDFFGRLITSPSVTTTKAAARKNVEKKYRVTYRFTEGNSAAVRKPVKVSAFL